VHAPHVQGDPTDEGRRLTKLEQQLREGVLRELA